MAEGDRAAAAGAQLAREMGFKAGDPTDAGALRATMQPGAAQERSKFTFDVLRFPSVLGTDPESTDYSPRYSNWVKFTPLVQEGSTWDISQSSSNQPFTGGSEPSSGTDRSSYGKFGQENPFDFGKAEAAAQVAQLHQLGSAGIDLLKNLGKATISNKPATAKAEAVAQFTGDVVKTEVVTGLTAGMMSGMKLGRKVKRTNACICLYMPDNVEYKLGNKYDATSLTEALGRIGVVEAAGSDAFAALLGNQTPTGTSPGVSEASAEIIKAYGAGIVGSSFTDFALFSSGVAQNPQVELLYKSIDNRTFSFNFRFIPKNDAEAKTVLDIIKAFRFFAAPELPKGGSGRYFIPPSEFEIEFMIGTETNLKLPKIAGCVLEGIDVNYSPNRQWSTFEDGMPVEISLSLQFKEVEIMHKKLIEQGY